MADQTLHVVITANSSGLSAAADSAVGALDRVGGAAQSSSAALVQGGERAADAVKRMGDQSQATAAQMSSQFGGSTRRMSADMADMVAAIRQDAQSVAQAMQQAGTSADAGAAKVSAALVRTRQQMAARNQDARDVLGLRSFAEIERDIDRVNAAYKRLADSGRLSAPELAAAARAQQASVARLKEEMLDMGKAGQVSAGQTAAAMRQLPAQFSDIAAGLQGGQSPLTILMQQGGQIKDSFGGVGAATRAMGGYVLGLIGPVTAAAAAVATLGAAWLMGRAEAQAYTNALILSGNAAGTNAGAMADMARQVSTVVGSQGKAAEVLTQLASAGNIDASGMTRFAAAAIQMERATGTATSETVKQFSELGKSPVDASVRLNETTNYLTVSVYRQIKALQDQGRAAEAGALAQKAWADALNDRADKVLENLGLLERGWLALKDGAKSAWDAMLNIGREETLGQKIEGVKKRMADLQQFMDKGGRKGWFGERIADDSQMQMAALQQELAGLQQVEQAQQAAASAAAKSAVQVKSRVEWDKLTEGSLSQQVKLEQDIAKARNMAAAAGVGGAELSDYILRLREQAGAFDLSREAAKSWADTVKGFADISASAAAGTLSLTAGQAKLLAYLTSPQYVQHSEAMRQIALQQAYAAIGAEKLARVTQDNTKAQDDFVKAQADAEASTEGLTKSQASLITYLQSPAYAQADEATRRLTLARAYDAIGAEQQAAAHKAGEQAIKDAHKAHLELIAGLDKSAASVAEQVRRLEDEESAAYIAAAQNITLAQAIARVEIARLREKQVAMMGNDEAVLAIQKEIDARQKLADITDRKDVREASDKALKEEAAAWAKTWDQIGQSVTDSLFRAFESGKGFGKGLLDTLKASFKSTVLRVAVQPLLTSAAGSTAAFMGMPAQASAAGPAGAAGGGNPLASLGSLSSMAGMGNLFSAGSALAMNGGTGQALGWAGDMLGAGQIGSGLSAGAGAIAPWAGAIMAGGSIGRGISGGRGLFGGDGNATVNAGMAIGALMGGPLGAALGGAVGGLVNRAFGRGKREVQDSGISGTLGGSSGASSVQTFEDWRKKGGWFSRGSSGTDAGALDSTAADALQQAVAQAQTQAKAWAAAIGASADQVDGYTQAIRVSLKGLDATQAQAAIDAELGKFRDGLAGTVSDALANLAKPSETAGQTLQRLGESITLANTTLGTLRQALFAVSLSGADAASKLVDAFGGAAAFAQDTGAYYQAFYTQAERAADTTQQVSKALADMGLAMPDTLAGYRQLVSAQDLNTEAGRSNYAALVKLSAAFSSVHGTADDAAQAVSQLGGSLVDEINRLRGVGADGTRTQAQLLAQFATTRAQAAAGDQAALQSLPALSQALESAATANASSAADAVRMRAWLSGSLSETLAALGGQAPVTSMAADTAAGVVAAASSADQGAATTTAPAVLPASTTGSAVTVSAAAAQAAAAPAPVAATADPAAQALLAEVQALLASNEALRQELAGQREEIAALRAESRAAAEALVSHASKTARILTRVSGNGDAITTTPLT